MTKKTRISAGRPHPMGATPDAGGVNFAVFSQNATRMQLCLFERYGRETARIDMPEREGHVWHCYVHGLRPGQHYGFRAHGPYRPDEGHRFNPNKLLIDPYARQISGHPIWHDALQGYDTRSKLQDLSYDTRDSAPYMPRAVVCDTSKLLPARHPDRPMADTVIYEAHVAGMTADRPDIANRGRFQGLASDRILDHLGRLGVTAIELLPVHAFVNDRFLVEKGLSNYWGYQSLGFFAPEPRYLAGHDIAEFRAMVDRFHAAGIEVLLDVVYNHTGEGNQMGPTLSFRGLDNASYYRLAENRRHYIDDTGTGNTLNIEHPMVLRMVMDSLRYWVEVMGVDGFRFDLCTALGRRAEGFDRNAPFFQAIRQDPVLGRVKLIAEPWDIGPGGYQLGAYPAPFSEWNDKFRDQVRDFWRGSPGMIGKLAARISGSARQFDHDNRPATASVNFLTAHDGFTLMDVVSYNEKHNEANGEDNRDGHSANHSDNMGIEGPTEDSSINAARAQAAQHAGDLDAEPGHADAAGGRRTGQQPAGQQQRLLPEQRDRLGQLGGHRSRLSGLRAQARGLSPRPSDPAAEALPACAQPQDRQPHRPVLAPRRRAHDDRGRLAGPRAPPRRLRDAHRLGHARLRSARIRALRGDQQWRALPRHPARPARRLPLGAPYRQRAPRRPAQAAWRPDPHQGPLRCRHGARTRRDDTHRPRKPRRLNQWNRSR